MISIGEQTIVQIFDKIYKRILTLSAPAVIRYINGLFHKDYPLDSRIGYHWTENIKDNLDKTISDNFLSINETDKFHSEVQIDSDSTIIIRIFEYGFQDALKYKIVDRKQITLKFPEQKIIFLEHRRKSPESVSMVIIFPDKSRHAYTVPVMNFLSYSIDELDRLNLIILIPLYLLKLRKEVIMNKKTIMSVPVRAN